jgi:hypothetical protein
VVKITKTCRECGIPLGIARTMGWNSDGTIAQKKDPAHRMIFFECDNLDRMWSRLSELLGVTHEHVQEIVIDSKSRATRAFLYRTLPSYVNLLTHFSGYKTMISTIEAQGLVMGYGKITIGGQFPRRGRPERITVFVEDPYSLPLFCGDFKGAAEVSERREAKVDYQALDSRRHQIDVTMRRERLEEEQLKMKEEVRLKPGDVEYRRCPVCDTPLELAQFTWDLESGVVKEIATGRRLAFFGTTSMKAVFDELKRELGERITGDIIDIERENAFSVMSKEEALSGYEALRKRATIRGLGLLSSLEMDQGGMRLVMSNPSVPEYVIGLALGIYELAFGKRGEYKWEIAPDGDLRVEITA